MIESMAEQIAVSIKRANEKGTVSVEVMKFSLTIILNTAIILVLITIGGTLTGKLPETLCAFLAFAGLRIVSGGFHFNTALLCTLASTLLLVVIPHVPITKYWDILLLFLSLLLVGIYAPSNLEGHSRIGRERYPLLKGLSLVIVGMNFIWLNPILTKAFLAQSLLLIRIRR
ncbi:accessory gene regulator ArgB-like protein [Brevibacillus borstelensis]|uniref:accessory gene regulator ArgB-like protein n=1 Tax=Brevibacillus borstelensis TaxID=45462 RepID=UPI0030C1213E